MVLARKALGFGAVEARVHAFDVIEGLGDAHPAGKDGDVGDEADIAHEVFALLPRVAAEDAQRALEGGEAEDGVERGCLARAVGTDEAEDAAFFDAEIDSVECGC